MATKEEILKLLAEYADMMGEIPDTGVFNIVTVINNLEDNIYFSDKPELYAELKQANADKDLVKMQEVLDKATGSNAGVSYELEQLEKEKGMQLPDTQREALDQQLKDIDNGVANGTLNPQEAKTLKDQTIDQAFLIDPEEGTNLVTGEDGKKTVSTGYFSTVLHSHIFAQDASVPEIVQFQNYLIENGLATNMDFAGTKGLYSDTLKQKIQEVMLWADANLDAGAGTSLHEKIMNQPPLFFADVQYQEMDLSFERNLFGHAVEEMSRRKAAGDDISLSEEIEAMAQQYIPPKPSVLEDMVESYFVANTGRSPTASELNDWSTALASSYSESYAQAVTFMEKSAEWELTGKPTYTTQSGIDPMTERPKTTFTQTGTEYNLDELSQYKPMTPAEIFEAKFEEELESDIDAFAAGKEMKEMQNKLMSAMYGG